MHWDLNTSLSEVSIRQSTMPSMTAEYEIESLINDIKSVINKNQKCL